MILEGRGVQWSIRERRRFLGKAHAKDVLRGIDLGVHRGEVVGLQGPSGIGKTTLGMCLLKLLPGGSGTILWDGQDVSAWPERRLRPLRRKFQVLLQSPYAMLTPFMTVRQHLDETLRLLMDVRRPGPSDWGPLVDELNLADVLDSMPGELSGGEARRVGLARVLLCKPEFLFADEPDAGLDPPRRMALASRLRQMARQGMAILVVTHDDPTLQRVSDRLYRLDLGTLEQIAGEHR